MKDSDETILDTRTLFLSVIGALLYLIQCAKLDIAIIVNLDIVFAQTRRHWNAIKYIICYFCEIIDLELFYSNSDNTSGLFRYTDAVYLFLSILMPDTFFYPCKSRSKYIYIYII